jgi:hypothetical protein
MCSAVWGGHVRSLRFQLTAGARRPNTVRQQRAKGKHGNNRYSTWVLLHVRCHDQVRGARRL